jgi:hypothetical protein
MKLLGQVGTSAVSVFHGDPRLPDDEYIRRRTRNSEGLFQIVWLVCCAFALVELRGAQGVRPVI